MTDFSDRPAQPSGEVIIFQTDDSPTMLSVSLKGDACIDIAIWPYFDPDGFMGIARMTWKYCSAFYIPAITWIDF